MKIYITLLILLAPFISYSKYWEQIDLPAGYDNNLYLDVYFLKSNPNYGWICGFNGKTLRTTNKGRTWSGTTIPGADHLENIHFANTTFGITSGPTGVFRSTNGGASWTEITPDIGGRYWGNFVIDNDFALLAGGGCVGSQEFRYTTDGGDNWILNTHGVPNSGLTDIKIIVPGGLGFATSSGMIWITEDGGISWEVLESSGSNIWQEEVSYSGGSFLVPYAGNNCQGSSVGGGMRFSDNYGQNWKEHSIGIPMYGAFLNSASEGWGCGVDREVVHTTDAGESWLLKNCGIESGDLDDIWFINSNEGFVVGHGVFKLSDPIAEVNPLSLETDKYCINEVRFDTIQIKSYSFYNENVAMELIGNNDGVFSIVSPDNQNFSILNCNKQNVVIRTSATKSGTYTAQLVITYKPGEGPLEQEFTVDLKANIVESTAEPETDEVIIESLYCNTPETIEITWSSLNFDEYITDIIQLNENILFSVNEELPIDVSSISRNVEYGVILRDTGWTQETFLHKLSPCEEEFEISISVYGYSSIINGPEEFNFYTECNEPVEDSIPVTNTGNYELEIDDVFFVENDADIHILGWDNPNTNETIGINETKYLKLRYNAVKPGNNSYTLRFINNDSTKVNGNKNPFDIIINTENQNVDLSARDTVINLDSVCIGDESSALIVLRNFGSDNASLSEPDLKEGFSLFSINQFPLNINPFDSVSFNIIYTPEVPGKVSDTLLLRAEPCGQTVNVIVNGFGLNTEISAEPSQIDKVVQSAELNRDTINIENNSNTALEITDISISPLPDNITFEFLPSVPFTLAPFEDFELIVNYTSKTDTSYSGEIIITADAECETDLSIPVEIISQSRLVEHSPAEYDFGTYYCEFPYVQKEILLENMGVKNDTIISYELKGDATNFELFGFDTPMEIEDVLKFYVYFTPKTEGAFNTEIVIKTKEPNGQTITIPVSGEFYKSEIEMLDDNTTALEIVEHCDDTLHYSFEFANNGLLADTLTAEDITDYNGFYIENNMQEILSGDTVSFNFFIVPAELDNNDYFDNLAEINSIVCDTSFTISIPVERIEPRLDYSPEQIIISDMWMRDTARSSFTITNNSNYQIFVEDFYTVYSEPEIIFEREPGFNIMPGGEESVGFIYVAAEEGNLQNTIRIIERRNCLDSGSVAVEIEVQEEIYNIDLYIDEYEAVPGEKIDIELVLTDSVYKFTPDETRLGVNFNERLFYPENVKIRYDSEYNDIDYQVINSELFITVNEDISNMFFSREGTILIISGTALAYVPNSTELIISEPEFLPAGMPVVFVKDDGLLTVVDFCEPEAEYRRLVPVALGIDEQSIFFDNIDIELTAAEDMEIEYTLYDIFGKSVYKNEIKLHSGQNTININSGGIASGTYHLRIFDGNKVYMKKIILMK